MVEINTVTIPLEEYIELRRKADENLYLATQLGSFENKMWEFENKLNNFEMRLEHGK